jgi:4-amino-4-deoxy-L-arabinose transferase-like glycosyltransferase
MLFACLVLLPLLGHKPLTDWDEGIYAEVAREMLSGNWLVPHWNLQPWFEKPPLLMWITAVLFKLFGIGEFTARAASALSGVAIVTLLHAWLAHKRDLLTAWLSTLILLATFGFLHVCRVGETDVLLSLGCMIALIGLSEVAEHHPAGWCLFWIGLAIAVMTKGAAAITLPLTAAALACIPTNNQQPATSNRVGKAFWLGLALFLLLVLPWHLAMYHLFGTRFLAEYFGLHVLARATQQIEGHTNPWWYYFKVLLVSAPPFVLLYPPATAHALFRTGSSSQPSTPTNVCHPERSEGPPHFAPAVACSPRALLRPFAIFALVVLSFFTLVETRLPHYIAPAYPALAVLTAAYVADKLKPLLTQSRPTLFWIKLTLATTAIWLASVLLTAPARKGLHSATLADGTVLPDNKDSIALLRDAFRHPQPIPGPLLLWREGRIMSIATDVFYSHRQVQQVEIAPTPPNTPTDRYTFNPEPLTEAVTSEPRLILLDKTLIPQIPASFLYTPIESGSSVELGLIVRAR